ncbi:kinase-like domain-containing protein [Mycena vulgaris]|nr:kinase-like domain-containing protein [Mycena vulgaris]
MFALLSAIFFCLGPALSSHLHTLQSRGLRTLNKAVDRVVVVVGAIVVNTTRKKGPIIVPPLIAPTKTFPIWLPPTRTFPPDVYHPLYAILLLFTGIASICVVAALVTLGVSLSPYKFIRRTGKTFAHRCQAVVFMLLVSLPLFVAGVTTKVHALQVGRNFIGLHVRSRKEGTRRTSLQVWDIPGSVVGTTVLLEAYIHILAAFIAGLSIIAKSLGYNEVIDVIVNTVKDRQGVPIFNPVATGIAWSCPRHWRPLHGFNASWDPATLRIGQDLGSGGYGDVVKAELGADNAEIAIKRVRKAREGASEELVFDLLTAELDVHLLMAEHPAFPTIYGVFEDQTHYFLAMDCGKQCLLDVEIDTRDIALFYGAQLVLALHELHKRGILHADVKPDNLLLKADSNLMIIDYGLATVFDMATPDATPAWHSLRQAATDDFPVLWTDGDIHNPHTVDMTIGTEGYMSPVVYLGPCSYGADFFAVGIIIHYWLTGHVPELSDDFVWTPDPDLLLSEVERDFIFRMLSYEEGSRFETYTELKAHELWEEVPWADVEDAWHNPEA